MDNEQPMGVPRDVLEGDVVIQDIPHVDAHGSKFWYWFWWRGHVLNNDYAPEYAVKEG